jgi:hypothetical protein
MLLTLAGAQCPFGCQYCFAAFSQYEKPLTLDDVESSPKPLEGVDVIYPACDVDLFATSTPMEVVRRAAAFRLSISISTKAALSEQRVMELAEVGRELEDYGRVLKIGVSISTKHNIRTLEPRTCSYSSRLENLRLLQRASVTSCLVLKPILSDISLGEYSEIIDDICGLTDTVLIGDEYLDASKPRISLLNVTQRPVNWVNNTPNWPVSTQAQRASCVKAHAKARGLRVYDSDLDLMAAFVKLRRPEPSFSAVD